MGKWKGALKVAVSNSRSNERNAFVHGLKILKPLFLCGLAALLILHVAGEVTGQHYLQGLLYTLILYTLEWRTLIQIAPLIDELLPTFYRIIGLGALVKLVTYVGGAGIGFSWLRNQK